MNLALRNYRWKLFATVMVAFLLVGAVSSYLQFSLMRDRVMNDSKSDLITIARLISLQVDGDEHEKLVSADQMESALYREQNDRLGQALQNTAGIRFVYTLRKVGDKYFFVLDPTPPGDSDGDGVEDKSFLMDEYSEVDEETKRAFQHGTATASQELGSDRWGTFLTGYAPVVDSKGRVVAMLGVDKDAGDIAAAIARLRWTALATFFVAVAVGLFVAILVARQSGRQPVATTGASAPMTSFASVLLQSILLSLVFGTLLAGTIGFLTSASNERRILEMDAADQQLRSLRSVIEMLAFEPELEPGHVGSIAIDPSSTELLWLEPALERLNETIQKNPKEAKGELRSLLESVNAAEYDFLQRREQLAGELNQGRHNYTLTLLVAVLLSFGSLGIVRLALKQQSRLVAATEGARNSQRSYQLVVESLPVGLFEYRSGQIFLSNWCFDVQTERQPSETAYEALVRSLADEDRDRVLETLRLQEQLQEPFTAQFRLRTADGRCEHYESRGVPIFDHRGELAHLMCFNIPITEIVEANRVLHEKNLEVQAANEQLQQTFRDLETNFIATVHALVKAVEAKDPYTAGHSDRVMRYSVAIGERAGLSADDLQLLTMGTLIHDIGKIGIPDGILTKPDRLTEEEYKIIQRHAELGAKMIETIPLFQDCVPIVRWHHERLDGSGYPDGIQGDALNDLVRIAAVADCFDAMTSTRAYRRGLPAEIALAELRKDADLGRLDTKFVELLADIIAKEGVIEHLEEPLVA